jgi:hypothetical protein
MFKRLAEHRRARAVRLANIVRPDTSYQDLLRLQKEGYTQVVFVKNPIADEECAPLDGNIYEISELLKLDNPLFRISHPNCLCKFVGYKAGAPGLQTIKPMQPQTLAPQAPAPLIQKPAVPPMTIQPAPK